MHEEGKLITAVEAIERLGQAVQETKNYTDNLINNIEIASHDEVNKLYEEYLLDILYPFKDIYVYLYNRNTLYFTHKKINDHKDRALTEEYLIKSTDPDMSSKDIPWYSYRDSITKIESDKIIAPKSIAYWFMSCSALTNIDDLSNWNTSRVTNMDHLFSLSKITNLKALSNWNTSKVTKMSYVFMNCSALTNLDGLSNWNTSSVIEMDCMFQQCSQLSNIDALTNWNISNVTNIGWLFLECPSLTSVAPLSDWNTSEVTNMICTFYNCSKVNTFTPLNNWNVSKVTSHSNIFYKTTGTRPSWGVDWN